MIASIRAGIRLLLFFTVTLLTVLSVGLGNLFLGIFNRNWSVRWKNICIKNWARITGVIIGLKLNVKGTSPDPPFFLVSNHLSYIDVVPLWAHLDATFVAKSEVKSWPFFGWGTRTLGVLFIDRNQKRDVQRMNKRISDVISSEQGVIIFPEGTSTKGATVAPFNAPLLQYPASEEMPVHYATLSYDTGDPASPAHLDVCWWGEMEFFPHFWKLLRLKGFECTLIFGDQTVKQTDRKVLARDLQKAVSNDFLPVINEVQIQNNQE